MFWPTIRALNDHGFVAATINYRFARDEARAYPVGVRDTRCALAFLKTHASDYGADPERIALIGASSGGHIAAMIGVAPNEPELMTGCEDVPLKIAGVVSYYAPLNLAKETGYPPRMHMAVWEFLRVDAGTPEWDSVARRASPATYVDETDPPFLLLHGTSDNVVPVDDSRLFKRALDEHHVPSLLVEVPEKEHGFPVLARLPELTTATCTAWAFLDRVLAR
jgi:acetyl esterase/lipase